MLHVPNIYCAFVIYQKKNIVPLLQMLKIRFLLDFALLNVYLLEKKGGRGGDRGEERERQCMVVADCITE
jgi:hypothetical protein